MFGSKKKIKDDFPDEEWNFLEALEEDFEACLIYEFAREIGHPETYFSSFVSKEQVPFALEPISVTANEGQEASDDSKQVRATMFIKPFEAADDGSGYAGREMFSGLYFLHPDQSLRGYPTVLQEKPWLALDDSWQSNLQLYAEQIFAGITFHTVTEPQNWEKHRPGIIEELSGAGRRRLLAVNIDWSKNDSVLVEGFATWLRKQRPKKFPSISSAGRQSTVDSLNALSSLRLRHHYSIEDAMKHTKAVMGKPLYNDRSSWDRAQRRAAQMFIRIFPGAGTPKSEARVSNREQQNSSVRK